MDYAILNGKIIKEEKAMIPLSHKGYFYDFAVYSSLKVIQGKILFPEYHIERLFGSARLIGLKHRFSKTETLEWLNLLVRKNKIIDGLLKIILIGDMDDAWDVRMYILPAGGLICYPEDLYQKGAKLITYRGERRIPRAKTTDLLLSCLAYREAKKAGSLDALLVDRNNNIREGTRTNFYALKGRTIITAPAAQVLEGITKKIVFEVSKKYFKIKEEDISLAHLKNYDEFFVTSTSMNVMPVNQIDSLKINTDFKKTKQIGKLFNDYYRRKFF